VPGTREPNPVARLLGDLDPELLVLRNQTRELLRQTFPTPDAHPFPVNGTGCPAIDRKDEG
jgi:hypothetical protein